MFNSDEPFDPMSISSVGGLVPTNSTIGQITPFGQGGFSGLMANSGLGFNLPTLNFGLQGLSSIGGLWASMKAMDVAKKQLAFTKRVTNANLANQTQSYNTQLADRARSRGVVEGQSQMQVDDYVSKNRLPPRTV